MELDKNEKKFNGVITTLRIIAKNFGPVARQNAVNLVNAIFLIVSSLLLFLRETREGFFLGSVLVLNLVIGIVQDLRAKVALEKLQILAAPRIVRALKDGQTEIIGLGDVAVGDILQLDIGDQVPADGVIVETCGIEVNEALITGESNYAKKSFGDRVLAGSIVMAGFAKLRVEASPRESYVVRMTEKIKKYQPNPSPIQKKLNTFIKYMTYILLVIIVYVVVQGIKTDDLFDSMVRDIGALTGTLVPQGLVLSITVFFAYGAIKMLKDNVLMQEINSTEKLARIKNLCVDKTGTLTERKPVLEETIVYGDGKEGRLSQMLAGYIQANRDNSEVAMALRVRGAITFSGKIFESMPFSSERKYGIAWLEVGSEPITAVLGAPDILLDYFADEQAKESVKKQIADYAGRAKRLILLAEAQNLPKGSRLVGGMLRPVALFVLFDPLRPGTEKIIDFFQDRDVRIRVISGDNPHTVQAVAQAAGMKYADMVVTGPEMESWDEVEYEERVPAFHLFARVKPGQKEKIVKLLKKTGYTAMVGDGANDALAMKKSDLGVAMFDGAPATRRIAQVVLMDNSFSALPKGVALAEAIISNIELVAGVFLNKVAVGLGLFLSLAALGYTFPLSPSNMTVINYFTIWLPLMYWTVFPVSNRGFSAKRSFASRMLLFSVVNAAVMVAAAVAVFVLEPASMRREDSNLLVMLALIVLGFLYFVLAPLNFGIEPGKKQRRILWVLGVLSAALIAAAIYVPGWAQALGLRPPELMPLLSALGITALFAYLQYIVAKRFFYNKNSTLLNN